ncbi:MAG TPA: c-type cytochrome [Gaiellaceae bacterium]|nr:c-type cytochrome [Gaiellaceae bacterium]
MSRRGRGAIGLAGLAAGALLAAGCGTGGVASGSADAQAGQKLFQSKCAGCHTLAAAGASGTVGPSLDAAFYSDRQQGYKDTSIENVVLDQIRLGSGPIASGSSKNQGSVQNEPTMPANIVTGADAVDVAAYVASVAGQSGPEAASPSTLGTDGKTIFSSECASCHTLKAAGSSGTVGPNLDQLKPPFETVQHQVEHGGGVMPAFQGKLSQAQIDAVAHFVADNAGK